MKRPTSLLDATPEQRERILAVMRTTQPVTCVTDAIRALWPAQPVDEKR